MSRQTPRGDAPGGTTLWADDDLYMEAVHQTVLKAPGLVADNREMITTIQRVIARYQQEVRLPHAPLTKRQIYYALVNVISLPKTEHNCTKVGQIITAACLEGIIPWAHIVDRSRRVRHVNMWPDLEQFTRDAAHSYRGDVSTTQTQQVLVWIEKEGLVPWVEQIVTPYGVSVWPGGGTSSWGLIYEAAQHMGDGYGWSVIYLGDFDPTGTMTSEHIRTALTALGCRPEWRVLAVRHEDMPLIPRSAWHAPKVEHYDARQERMVKGDPNVSNFRRLYGHEQQCAEVDAFPPALLRARLLTAIHDRMDMAAWRRRMRMDSVEKAAILDTLLPLANDPGERREMRANARHAELAYYNREDLAEAAANRLSDYAAVDEDEDEDDAQDEDA